MSDIIKAIYRGEYNPMEKFVDDAGTLHTDFDNGRRLGICPEVDSFHKIEPSEDPAESETPSVTM